MDFWNSAITSYAYIHNLINFDILTLVITILIAVFGWIIALFLQYRNIRQQYRVQIWYDIYKQFVVVHKEMQDALSKLAANAHPPFILMKTSMAPFNLKLKREYKGVWIPWTEDECVFEGEKKWTQFVNELQDIYSVYSNESLNFLLITEDWEAAIKPLLPVKGVFSREVESLRNKIYENLNSLQMYSVDHGHDWRKWDENETNNILNEINKDAITINLYLHDLMVLIHNELLSSYFGHKRQTRRTLDPEYKVVTKKGIVVNLDKKKLF